MNPTASDLPMARLGRSSARASMFSERGRVFDLPEGLHSIVISVPGTFMERWGLQEWDREEVAVWVNLDATGTTIATPVTYHLTPHHSAIDAVPIELSETMDELDALGELPPGWNGYDVAAPKMNSILQAKKWIRQMYEDVTRMHAPWHKPHVAADADGDVTFEWWNDDRGLTIDISNGGATYLIAWGTNMETDMEDGEAMTTEVRRRLWTWLTS
jgi:hypothetical protein